MCRSAKAPQHRQISLDGACRVTPSPAGRLFSDDDGIVCYAVAALQNACTSYEAAVAIRDGGVLAHLEKLANTNGSPVQQYAVGRQTACLAWRRPLSRACGL